MGECAVEYIQCVFVCILCACVRGKTNNNNDNEDNKAIIWAQ